MLVVYLILASIFLYQLTTPFPASPRLPFANSLQRRLHLILFIITSWREIQMYRSGAENKVSAPEWINERSEIWFRKLFPCNHEVLLLR